MNLYRRNNVPYLSEGLNNYHLRIAPRYVDLLCDLPDFRDFTIGQLLKMLKKKYHSMVPPVARMQEERMARAVVIGMLATQAQIEHYLAQKFVECLSD